ncbi:MAG: glycosyltransferase [Bacteriovoracia bacterium]
MSTTVVYVISEVQDAPGFAWLAAKATGESWRIVFVLMNSGPGKLEEQLRGLGAEVRIVPYAGRADIFSAFFSLLKIFRQLRPGTVHTHLLAANLAGLVAAWVMRVPNRIYTRHHSNPHELGPWYAKGYDFLANGLSTKIVATCRNVEEYLIQKEKVEKQKIKVVHLGFEPSEFAGVSAARISAVKNKYGYAAKAPVVGVISRYVPIKGVPYVIEAFAEVLREFPEACLVLANAGQGAGRAEIQHALRKLPPYAYREIAFESDSPALMRSFDVFVHVPVDRVSEAFGQVYIEALLSSVPSVTTLSGVAPEVLRDRENTLTVPFRDAAAIGAGILRLLRSPEEARRLAAAGAVEARSLFSMEKMVDGLRELYR